LTAQYKENEISCVKRNASLKAYPIWVGIERRKMKGLPKTLEHRQKLADVRVAKKISVGEKNPNWKGGISKTERGGVNYQYWRETIKRRDNYICQMCGIDGKVPCPHCDTKPRLHSDHIKPWAKYPELRYDLDNGRTLCEKCHYSLLSRKIG